MPNLCAFRHAERSLQHAEKSSRQAFKQLAPEEQNATCLKTSMNAVAIWCGYAQDLQNRAVQQKHSNHGNFRPNLPGQVLLCCSNLAARQGSCATNASIDRRNGQQLPRQWLKDVDANVQLSKRSQGYSGDSPQILV
eukprot:6175963-Pleurochrysis_carterae.AAC.2